LRQRFGGAIHEAAEYGRSAVIQAERAGIGGVLAEALTMSTTMDLYVARGSTRVSLSSLKLEDPDRRTMLPARPAWVPLFVHAGGSSRGGYRPVLRRADRMLGEAGRQPALHRMVGAAMACYLDGQAKRSASSSHSLPAPASSTPRIPRAFALSVSALLHAYRGNVDQAICEGEQALSLMLANGFGNGAGFP